MKLAILLLFSFTAFAFRVELKNDHMIVNSPKNVINPVSIVIQNSTNIKTHSAIWSSKKVLTRFVINGNDVTTLKVKLPKDKKLYYVSISPPSQAMELKFNQSTYVVPEKK